MARHISLGAWSRQWLAAVTMVAPGRANGCFDPMVYPQGVADKSSGELQQQMADVREARGQNLVVAWATDPLSEYDGGTW